LHLSDNSGGGSGGDGGACIICCSSSSFFTLLFVNNVKARTVDTISCLGYSLSLTVIRHTWSCDWSSPRSVNIFLA